MDQVMLLFSKKLSLATLYGTEVVTICALQSRDRTPQAATMLNAKTIRIMLKSPNEEHSVYGFLLGEANGITKRAIQIQGSPNATFQQEDESPGGFPPVSQRLRWQWNGRKVHRTSCTFLPTLRFT